MLESSWSSYYTSMVGVESRITIHDTTVNNKRFTAVKMASQFSGVLQLTDLDDFITPSQVVELI